MRSTYLPHIHNTRIQSTVFDRMLGVVRCHMDNLVNAINQLRCETAWLQKLELVRALDLAEFSIGRLSEAGRTAAGERLAALRSVALRVQAMAPDPTVEAIAQVRPNHARASRSAWESQQQEWIAQRTARAPVVIAIGAEDLTLSCLGSV
jgi:hypothetical protein